MIYSKINTVCLKINNSLKGEVFVLPFNLLVINYLLSLLCPLDIFIVIFQPPAACGPNALCSETQRDINVFRVDKVVLFFTS